MQPVIVKWPGGEHAMRLPLAQLEALQSKLDAGPEFLLNRIHLGQWRAGDLYEVLRWGLIGGGMKAVEADQLMRRVFDQHALAAYKVPALQVLCHAMYGPEDDPVGEDGPVGALTPEQQKTAG